MSGIDVSIFKDELIEIATYQISSGLTILYTMANLNAETPFDEEEFKRLHINFVDDCLVRLKEHIFQKTEEDGQKSFKISGYARDLFQRALLEAEMIKGERASAEQPKKEG
jgi:hypothetical protein